MTNNGTRGGRQTQFTIRNSEQSFALRRPALFHQREQVLERFLVTAIFFGGELAGALVQLRGHFGGFFRRTTKRDENLSQLR